MSHPELIFPLDEAHQALDLMGPDGLLHAEQLPSGHEPMEQPRRYTVNPALTAWAGVLHS